MGLRIEEFVKLRQKDEDDENRLTPLQSLSFVKTCIQKRNGEEGLMTQYWVLKTTGNVPKRGGSGGIVYGVHAEWTHFKKEGVIAIGWRISQNLRFRVRALSDIDKRALAEDLKETTFRALYDTDERAERSAKRNATTVLKFINEMNCGDKVLLSRGYTPNQKKDVCIYGYAQIKGPAWYDEKSNWWKIKREADISPIEKNVSKEGIAKILKKGSLRQTIHTIDKDSFEQVLD